MVDCPSRDDTAIGADAGTRYRSPPARKMVRFSYPLQTRFDLMHLEHAGRSGEGEGRLTATLLALHVPQALERPGTPTILPLLTLLVGQLLLLLLLLLLVLRLLHYRSHGLFQVDAAAEAAAEAAADAASLPRPTLCFRDYAIFDPRVLRL
ncbi:hypothetical protein MRB53_037539 [Persea americana]|nr:hypothetical protein MRB53_037539 [Persea americana]